MTYLEKLEHWGEAHHPKYLDIIRIAFGILLILKGIEFAGNLNTVTDLITQKVPFSSFAVVLLVHYIVFAHIAGGFMIASGLLTRVACIAQLPIVLIAIVFIKWSLFVYMGEIFISLLLLGLSVYFFIIGSGKWSLDDFLERNTGNL